MQKKLKSEILERIKEAVNELNVTSYQISKKTSLSELGVSKILSGKVLNPNENSIKSLSNFLIEQFGVSRNWLYQGIGSLKDLKVPMSKDFDKLSKSQKKQKLDEVAVFVAHHEKELMENPVFRSIVEKIGYQIVVKALKEEEHQGKGS